ncbi:MAG: outer membrane protein assembly factor BamB family protein [Verrucomicrobiales bacterium]
MTIVRLTVAVALLAGGGKPGFSQERTIAEPIYRVPLSEAGQSGVCVQGDRLFLTVHKKLEGQPKGGFYFNGNIVGQCFEKATGKLLWEAELPGTYDGRVLESWHDSTSLLPVATEEFVVFHNLNGMLACYSHAGDLIWNRKWQAPDPDIKNCRMFLHGQNLITALPASTIAVPASKKHPELPFYQLHSIHLKTGRDNWESPVLITHATQYSMDEWKGEKVIVASMIDLSHWKFGQGRKGFLISLENGEPIHTFELPPAIPHQKNQLCRGKFLVTSSAGRKTAFQLVDPETSKVTAEFAFEKPDHYFGWDGNGYVEKAFEPEYADRTLRGKGQPTPSTVHVVDDRIYFWRYDSGDIGCIDTTTGKSVLVEAPIQLLAEKTVWNKADFQFTKGILNSAGNNVNNRVGSVRGIQRGGFGHTNPAWPIIDGDTLYWQGGAGVLYLIDLTQPFSPEALSWKSTDPKGEAWTFGAPAIDADHIYVRSQRDLVKIAK